MIKFPRTDRQFRPSRRSVFTLAIVGLVAIGALIAFSQSTHRSEPAQPAAVLTVTSVEAQSGSWLDTVKASGPITAWQEAIVGSEISGQRLVDVRVNVGDMVTKGQILAQFNPDTIRAEQVELQANWVQSEADYKRAQSLKDSGALSDQQIDSYADKAAVAHSRLETKTLELHYTTVIAPSDGVISSRTATLGAVAGVGSELFRMIVDERIEWRGELTASQLMRVKTGQSIALTLPDGSKAEAIVRQTAPSLDTQSRLATVYADIKPDSNARAGMYADGNITLGQTAAIFVPAESVVIRDGHSYVFKLDSDKETSKIVQQEVTPGRRQDNNVEIVIGLGTGDHVAVRGAGFLNDGDLVRIVPATGTQQ
jgi:RND family efflux transporter MFP subunit